MQDTIETLTQIPSQQRGNSQNRRISMTKHTIHQKLPLQRRSISVGGPGQSKPSILSLPQDSGVCAQMQSSLAVQLADTVCNVRLPSLVVDASILNIPWASSKTPLLCTGQQAGVSVAQVDHHQATYHGAPLASPSSSSPLQQLPKQKENHQQRAAVNEDAIADSPADLPDVALDAEDAVGMDFEGNEMPFAQKAYNSSPSLRNAGVAAHTRQSHETVPPTADYVNRDAPHSKHTPPELDAPEQAPETASKSLSRKPKQTAPATSVKQPTARMSAKTAPAKAIKSPAAKPPTSRSLPKAKVAMGAPPHDMGKASTAGKRGRRSRSLSSQPSPELKRLETDANLAGADQQIARSGALNNLVHPSSLLRHISSVLLLWHMLLLCKPFMNAWLPAMLPHAC